MSITPEAIYTDLWAIRQKSPLVHNITNFVVMNTTANALLALGASPVMAHAVQEVEEMTAIASALVINIGTLSDPWVQAMFKAGAKAKQGKVPIVLDPVGVGATDYRTDTAKELVKTFHPDIIRGNASEIMALSRAGVTTKGVDSTSGSDKALEPAQNLNLVFGSTVCVTGKTDYIVSKEGTFTVGNGHAMMPRVTGLGCTASAVCGAFAAVNPNPGRAAAHALAVMGIAGEMAGQNAKGPGTLQLYFMDALFQMTEQDIVDRFRDQP